MAIADDVLRAKCEAHIRVELVTAAGAPAAAPAGTLIQVDGWGGGEGWVFDLSLGVLRLGPHYGREALPAGAFSVGYVSLKTVLAHTFRLWLQFCIVDEKRYRPELAAGGDLSGCAVLLNKRGAPLLQHGAGGGAHMPGTPHLRPAAFPFTFLVEKGGMQRARSGAGLHRRLRRPSPAAAAQAHRTRPPGPTSHRLRQCHAAPAAAGASHTAAKLVEVALPPSGTAAVPLPDLYVSESCAAVLGGKLPEVRLLACAAGHGGAPLPGVRHAASEPFVVVTGRAKSDKKVVRWALEWCCLGAGGQRACGRIGRQVGESLGCWDAACVQGPVAGMQGGEGAGRL